MKRRGCPFCLRVHTGHCSVADLKRRITRLEGERDDLAKACDYLSTEVDRHMEALKDAAEVVSTAADAVEANAVNP